MALAVVSCSSQCHTHRAENILRDETYRLWQTQNCDQATVVLSIQPATSFSKIELVNAGSQFVEVLASECDDSEEDWVALLPKSMFRTEKEVLAFKAKDRVRSMPFSPSASTKLWKRLKVVCSLTPDLVDMKDPAHGFGLASLKLVTPTESTSSGTASVSPSASLCLSPQASTQPRPVASTPLPSSSCDDRTPPTKMRRLDPSLSPDSKVVKAPCSPPASDAAKMSFGASLTASMPDPDPTRVLARVTSDSPPPSAQATVSPPSKPRPPSPDASRSILKGVCVAISGLENPARGTLRRLALDMGAEYSPHMDRTCTHVLCAISGTPRHTEAVRQGKVVVSPAWVSKCWERKRRVDEAAFAV